MKDLKERAEGWLLGLGVQLVILVDIQVCKSPREASTSSNEGDENPQATLPYGLKMDDLQNDNFRVIGSKILEWYKTQGQPIVQLSSGTIYLYRHARGKKSSINLDAEVVFYDCELDALDLEVHITTKDFGLSTSTISTNLKLPLDKLRAKIPAAMRAYSRELAEEQGTYLRNMAPKKMIEIASPRRIKLLSHLFKIPRSQTLGRSSISLAGFHRCSRGTCLFSIITYCRR